MSFLGCRAQCLGQSGIEGIANLVWPNPALMPLLPRETSCPTELQQPLDGLSSPPRKLSECYRAGKLPEEVSTDQESPTGSPKGAEEGGGQEKAQGTGQATVPEGAWSQEAQLHVPRCPQDSQPGPSRPGQCWAPILGLPTSTWYTAGAGR